MPKFRCEHCRQKIAAPDDYVGRRVRCPRCKQPVRVPEVVEAAAVAATPPATVMPAVAPATPPAPAAERSTPKATPSAAPFAREHRDEVFSRRSDADLSALFGDSPGEGMSPNDLAPEEQTQVFWQIHQVAEHHDPPPPPTPPATATPAGDFFEQPADEAPAGARPPPEAAHRMAREPEPAPAPVPEPMVVEPAEVIDAPVRRPRRGLNSAHEVADLLRRLDKPQQRARLAAEWVADVQQRTAPRGSRWIGVLGWASLAAGSGAVALSFLPAPARFAAPAGSAGLLMALVALVLAMGKRANVLAAMGGALVSAGGVVVAILVARGVLPTNAAARLVRSGSTPPVTLALDSRPAGPSDEHVEYVPATSPLIVGKVEVRVASALVLRPAVYSGDYTSLDTAAERRLQITVELKKVGIGQATYEPWRKLDAADVEAKVRDAAGAVLPLDERPFIDAEHPVTLAAGALKHPATLSSISTADVLLFQPPTDPAGDLLLDLPGTNIGAPTITLHIRIPAGMVRVQD